MAKGKFIVLEGLDGSGITTQTELLRTWCQGNSIPVAVTKEPSDGPVGGMIKWALRHELVGMPEEALALMFAADRRHHITREIRPALRKGAAVICDRYVLSSYAYQLVGVKDLTWLREINSKCPNPDLTVFLDVAPEQCLQRMKSDAWRGLDKLQLYERLSQLEATRRNFLEVIGILQQEGQNVVVVRGSDDAGAVHRSVVDVTAKLLGKTAARFKEPSKAGHLSLRMLAGESAAR